MPDESVSPSNDQWQERALAAEKKAGDLETSLAAALRTHQIDVQLMSADAVDLEAARVLLEAALAKPGAATIEASVADLKQRKPFLFRVRRGPTSGMSAAASSTDTLAEIAEHAKATGDRRALLHYLRSKRGV